LEELDQEDGLLLKDIDLETLVEREILFLAKINLLKEMNIFRDFKLLIDSMNKQQISQAKKKYDLIVKLHA